MRRIGANLLLTPDGSFLKNSYLEVQNDGMIVNVVDTKGCLQERAGIEFYNGILCPGFVNAHCHLELSHLLHRIEPHCGLHRFVGQVVKNRGASESDKYSAMRTADTYMQKSGIVAVGDISNGTDSFAVKKQSNIYYHSFVEVFGTGSSADSVFQVAQLLFDTHAHTHAMSIVPHSAYSVHPRLFELIAEHARANGGIQSVHSQETSSENDMFISKTGSFFEGLSSSGFDYTWLMAGHRSSLAYMLPKISDSQNVLFIHNTFADEEDLRDAVKAIGADRCYFVLCPLSNLHIENALPALDIFRPYSSRICIGTDSLASNSKLSVLEEIKCLQASFPHVSLSELLLWATVNGARALGIDSRIGSFEVGKKPGVLLLENVDLATKNLLPQSSVKVLI